jgi:BlaI family penicillinase repressor
MNNAPKITDTEWEIMRVIWARHPLTAFEIIAQLVAHDATWHPKTARALLARLVKKGALRYEARGRVYFYEPLVTERECITTASESFLDRVFGGSLQPMIAHFVERRSLSEKDLAELRQLLAPALQKESAKTKPKK